MIEIRGVRAILTDIEGTTGSISFVKDVLFPYAREHIPAYVRAHATSLAPLLDEVRVMEGDEDLDTDDIVALLQRWIDEDRKATPLKTLQGHVWKAGYESGAFQGHVYDDAADQLEAWSKAGLPIHVYSSGSVAAQKLIFGYSRRGDLTPLLTGYFDTKTGPKKEPRSYRMIAKAIDTAPDAILFLSDVDAELNAAREAGLQTVLLDRDGTQGTNGAPWPVAKDFTEIRLTPASGPSFQAS